MTEIPTPNVNPSHHLNKLKGLPPWAYMLSIGVGVGAVYYGIKRSQANAADSAGDVTGTDPNAGMLSATTAGDAYPLGSQGAAYPTDPTSGGTVQTGFNIDDISTLITSLTPLIGGGSQADVSAADHYVPPAITVNIPPLAMPTPMVQSPAAPTTAAKKPDPCTGEYPYQQDSGPRAGQCYKIVLKSGDRFRYYKGGDKVKV